MTFPSYVVSVDLGQVSDYTAICVLERREMPTGRMAAARHLVGSLVHDGVRAITTYETQTAGHYQVVHLERLPLGTSYADIPDRLRALDPHLQQRWVDTLWRDHQVTARLADTPIDLVVDQTGVGRPTVDLLREAGIDPICITITGGHEVTRVSQSEYRVPKRDLVSSVNAAMQTRRLRAAEALPDWPVLQAELRNFRVKISLAGHDSYAAGPSEDWRPGAHDDLVLALAMAIWWSEYMSQQSGGASLAEVAAAWSV